jgi:23S rRNA (pseudouridine1915-N3)-methyltransferase
MHIRLIAVGDRQPAWVTTAFDTYSGRLPKLWQFHLDVIGTAPRRKAADAARAVLAEGETILGKLKPAETLVLLDEGGRQLSSRQFADKLDEWQTMGRDLAFVIGGPDGVSAETRDRADFRWSLSALTLPHGLARVMFAEQLYRAWSLMSGHPYHRD